MNYILDIVTLTVSYLIACQIRLHIAGYAWHSEAFAEYGSVLLVAYICVALMTNGYADFARRSFESEIEHTITQTVLTWAVFVTFLYAVRGAEVYSRLLFGISLVISMIMIIAERLLWKAYVFNKGDAVRRWHKLLIITDSPVTYDAYVKHYIMPGNYSGIYKIAGILFLHENGTYTHDIRATYGIDRLSAFLEETGATEILTDISDEQDEKQLIDQALGLNVPIYKSLRESHLPYQDKKIARLGELWVIALYSSKMTLQDRIKKDYEEFLRYREESRSK